MTEAELLDIITKGVEMRAAQEAYFKSRDRGVLTRCKALERGFDKAAAVALKKDDLFNLGSEAVQDAPVPKSTVPATAASALPDAKEFKDYEYVVKDAIYTVVGARLVGAGTRAARVESDGEFWRIKKWL